MSKALSAKRVERMQDNSEEREAKTQSVRDIVVSIRRLREKLSEVKEPPTFYMPVYFGSELEDFSEEKYEVLYASELSDFLKDLDAACLKAEYEIPNKLLRDSTFTADERFTKGLINIFTELSGKLVTVQRSGKAFSIVPEKEKALEIERGL